MRKLVRDLPLFWRVFLLQAAVLVLAFLLLVLAPVTVSVPIALTELAVLAAGLVVMLALTLVLLRPVFGPLQRVTSTMRTIDPLSPGQRVPVVGEPDVAALAQAFNDMLQRLEDERRESARQALTVQEGERGRVARELHDEVGQIFTAIMLQIESLAARTPPQLAAELEELRETARTGATDVRRIAARLRPEALEDLGLPSALSALATAFADQTGVALDRHLEPVTELDTEQELVVYRVAQEALTNVARHAGAKRVELSLRRADDGAVVLRVRDDGAGLRAGALPSSSGIRGMRERAMLVGARLTLGPAPGGGTEVVLDVPRRGA
jgi:two-component system, NarL family, sensor histidine kinase UhpB